MLYNANKSITYYTYVSIDVFLPMCIPGYMVSVIKFILKYVFNLVFNKYAI